MKNFRECEESVSPVIGVILLVGMTVTMVSVIAVSVFAFKIPESPPYARIVIVEAKGVMTGDLYENLIVLRHKGGDILAENDTKIIIAGRGCAYTGNMSSCVLKDMRVTYRDLTGENYYYDGTSYASKKIMEGTSWDAGEMVDLYGRDGINIGSSITSNQGNTVDHKWKLAAGSTVQVTVIDIPTNQAVAISSATVKKV